MDWRRAARDASRQYERDRPVAHRCWTWVDYWAAQAWNAAADADGVVESPVSTALLTAVGNFKRQSPIDVGWAPDAVREPQETSLTLVLDWKPHERVRLSVSTPYENCQALESVHGVATATATSVLSALWPHDDWIMDSRSATPLAGLLHALDLLADARPSGAEAAHVTAESYARWYRPGIAAVAEFLDLQGRDIERACFLFPRPPNEPHRTWEQYAEQLAQEVRTSPCSSRYHEVQPPVVN